MTCITKKITIHHKTWDFACMSVWRLGVAGVIWTSSQAVKPVQVQTGRRRVPHPVIAVWELYMQHRNILGSAYRTFNHVPSALPLLPPLMLQQILHRSVVKTPVQSVIKAGRMDAGFDWAMKPPHCHSTSTTHPDTVFEVEQMAASNYLSSPLAGGLQNTTRFAG